MTTLSKVGNKIVDGWHEFKEKFCDDGQLCNDMLSIGGLLFMCWFMYIAMLPIM